MGYHRKIWSDDHELPWISLAVMEKIWSDDHELPWSIMGYHGKTWSDDHELPRNIRGYHGKKYGQMTMKCHGIPSAILEKNDGQMTTNN